MVIEQTFTVQVPLRQVWDLLFDIPRVSACMPGIEQVKQVDAENYTGVFKVKVGPIGASFAGKVKLLEVEAPHRLVARAEGSDARTASLATGTFTSGLKALSPDRTEIYYQIDFGIRGALGRFGQGVMQEIAKRMAAQFASCLETQAQASVPATENPSASSGA